MAACSACSVLEAEFLKQPSGLTYVGVGLIEEAVKLGALWVVAWRLPRYTMRDGIVLGATVGFGFAAFETAGYAFNAAFTLGGLSLQNLVETEILRGLLTPVGHGLWTAILGGVLFRPPDAGRCRAVERSGHCAGRPVVDIGRWLGWLAELDSAWASLRA